MTGPFSSGYIGNCPMVEERPMFDPIYVRDVSCRLHLLSRDCHDPATARELSRIADEMHAKAEEAESLTALVCTLPECGRRQNQ